MKLSNLPPVTAMITFALLTNGISKGFLGHEITLYTDFYTHDGSQPLEPRAFVGTALVGSGVEFGGTREHVGGEGEFEDSETSTPPIDIDASTIELREPGNGRAFRLFEGLFNGIVFEDTNDTLPPFASVTIDREVSTLVASRVYFTANTIWLNSEGAILPPDGFVIRLHVSFAPKQSPTPQIAIYPAEEGMKIIEAVTQPGALYGYERSDELITFSPMLEPFLARQSFRSWPVKSTTSQAYFRLKMLEQPNIPLRDDFESGAEGWSHDVNEGGTDWELGVVSNTVLPSGIANGSQVFGTNLDGDYAAETVTSLRSPLVDLREHAYEAALTFRYLVDTPKDQEGGQLRFVGEDGAILYTHEKAFTGKTENWTPFRFVLPKILQDTVFRVEFRFLSDADDKVGTGWFIDDVMVL